MSVGRLVDIGRDALKEFELQYMERDVGFRAWEGNLRNLE